MKSCAGCSVMTWKRSSFGAFKTSTCAINHFSDGSAVVGRLTLGKIDSSEWHNRSPLRVFIDLLDGGTFSVPTSCPGVRLLKAGKKKNESLGHSRVRENCIAQSRVRKPSKHCHLNNGHHFTGLRPDHRKTKNAITIRFDHRFHKSEDFIYGS